MLVPFLVPGCLLGDFDPDIRTVPAGNRTWQAAWTRDPDIAGDVLAIVAVNGRHYASVLNRQTLVINAPFGETPTIQVRQYPAVSNDPGYFPSHEFGLDIALLNNKAILTWNPPASIDDVEKYRIYWDAGTGTVGFTPADVFEEVAEDGRPSYELRTRELAPATYKFVIRAVTEDGAESSSVAELTVVVPGYIDAVTGEALTYDFPTKKATLTWTLPSGATAVDIFKSDGTDANQVVDYDTPFASLGAVSTFLTPALSFPGTHVFGIRAKDASNFELNTSVTLKIRLDATGAEITAAPPAPVLAAEQEGADGARLQGVVDVSDGILTPDVGRATKIKFYQNDGVGGAVDYSTPIADVAVSFDPVGSLATFLAGPFPSQTRVFGAEAFTATSGPSERAVEQSVVIDTTLPANVVGAAGVAGR